jgi:colicin import membrane protein
MQAVYREPGLVPSGVLAVSVHIAFFALLVLGVNWQNKISEPIVVDVWDEIPSVKVEPEPAPPPPPPKPEPKVEEKPPPPPPPKPRPVEPSKADIELKAKQELERKRKKEEEIKHQEELKRQEEERREEKKRKEEETKRNEEERKVQEEARKREEATLEQMAKQDEKRKRDEELKRKREAEQASAQIKILEEHIARIRAKIQSKVNLPPGLAGNPEAQYSVTLLPGGDVLEIRLMKSSGVAAYDHAVERAIKASEPLPVPSQPELFQQLRVITLKFRPIE